jgi:hypothetical protein
MSRFIMTAYNLINLSWHFALDSRHKASLVSCDLIALH